MPSVAPVRTVVIMTPHLHRLSGAEVASLTTTTRPHAESVMLWAMAGAAALVLIIAGIASLLR